MGKSSSQVVGYRYYSNYLAFIGNRIERLLGFNFNKQGWIPVIRRIHHSTYQTDYIHLPNHYGENEGGISGTVYTYLGDNYQLVDTALDADEKGEASAFPYQSYCCFNGGIINPEVAAGLTEGELQEIADQYHDGVIPGRGFYLGNSGYMKEMLLWVKRIHVKNNGDVQWHDSKSAIDSFNRYEPAPYDEYRSFQVLQEMTVRWSDPSGEYTRPAGGAAFPMSELGQSYSAGAGYNSDPLPEKIGIIAAAPVLSAANMPADMGEGTILPPAEWTSYPPITDGFWNGAVVRDYAAKGRFYWNGGQFLYRSVMSKNFAQLLISTVTGDQVTLKHIIHNTTNDDYKYLEGEINLPAGMYELQANIGERYFNQGTPRPFLHLQVKAKSADPIDAPDINPIHKIREILTDDTAMNKPESDVNEVNFMKAADRIWDEGLGISWAIDEKSCIDAIEQLCYHIEAGVRVNRQTGLYEMVLFRDDWFESNEIHDIAESKIKDLSLEVMNSDDIVNQLNVTYYDRQRIKNSTFSVYENGSILTMGHANAESVEFPYFMNMRNAEIVANWKLKQFSTPAWSGSFTTGWKEARKWNRYDLIRLPWSKKWNGTILARIMKINLGNGTDNTVTIDFEEVIPYSGEMNTSIVVDAPVESASKPPQPSMNAVFEAPYYLTVLRAGQTNADLELSNNPNIGYVAAIAAKPQSNSLNALLYTDGGVGGFEQASRLDYCDILQLDQPIIETTSSFTVNGSLTQIANSNNLILLNDELMGFVSFDNETKVLTVKRGVLDTIPRKHSTGSLFVFDLPDVAFDPTQYTESEVIEAQVLTTTPSGIQELNATGNDVEIKSRAIRPYPPANVKINGEYWPEEVGGSLNITWAHRNRLQQTGGDLIDWYSGSVTPEPDVTYSIELINTDTGAVLSSASGLSVPLYTVGSENLAPNNLLKIWSERNGYESLNKFFHNFTTTSLSPLWKPENLSLLPSILEYSESNVTVDGNGKVTSWGSSITAVAATAPTVRNDIYDFPVIHLPDANAFMRVPNASVDIMDNEFWAFMVLHVDGYHGRILDIGVNATISDGFSIYGNIAVSARRKSTDTPVTASSLASSPLRMVYARVKWDSEDTLEISSNGKALSSTAALPSGVKPTLTPDMLLGRSHQGGNNAGAGYISVMFGNSTNRPNQSQIDKLFGWAAHKYGIANQLPMGHPYKTDPPRL